jgi:hypothetical protein
VSGLERRASLPGLIGTVPQAIDLIGKYQGVQQLINSDYRWWRSCRISSEELGMFIRR